MLNAITQFSQTASTDGDVLSSLGIDWTLIIVQTVAFLLLAAILAKFVYPTFLRILDKRDEAAQASAKAAEAAKEHAEKAETEVEKLLAAARKDAREIVTTAKDEANATIEAAEDRAKSKADQLVASAHEQLNKDVLAARETLRNDTIELVALATEQVVGKTISTSVDESVIKQSIKEAK